MDTSGQSAAHCSQEDTLRILVAHPASHRPHDPVFQALLSTLNESVVQSIRSVGAAEPELLAAMDHGIDSHLDAVHRANAVIVMGGEDVHPSFATPSRNVAESPHAAGSWLPHADRAHLALLQYCLDHHIPVLAICRGLQLLNVACGGTLIQHMTAPAAHHREHHADPFVHETVAIESGSALSDVLGEQLTVTCTHHQAIETLGRGLKVIGRSSDGTVEAIVHHQAPITGVQWHPEHPDTSADQLVPLIRMLLRQVAESRRVAPVVRARGTAVQV